MKLCINPKYHTANIKWSLIVYRRLTMVFNTEEHVMLLSELSVGYLKKFVNIVLIVCARLHNVTVADKFRTVYAMQ